MTTQVHEPELVKSANKKNTFFGTAMPLDEKLVTMIEDVLIFQYELFGTFVFK